MNRLDIDLLDDENPFEIDTQLAHLFKHASLGVGDIIEVWTSAPLFYPARPPADWLMVSTVGGTVIAVPLAPARSGIETKCRPIGCYIASRWLAARYWRIVVTSEMTPEEEYEFYARPENQVPVGPPRRRKKASLTAPIPVRFPEKTMEEIKRRADADDRSVSSWIRRAVEAELNKPA